jgi:hypothetical protein
VVLEAGGAGCGGWGRRAGGAGGAERDANSKEREVTGWWFVAWAIKNLFRAFAEC